MRVRAWIALTLGAVTLAGAIGFAVLDAPRPEGVEGPEAEALARRLAAHADSAGWAATGAIEWRMGGRREHLWDRTRGRARVRFGGKEVLLELRSGRGVAREGGAALAGATAEAAVAEAHRWFVNDSFWLHPIASMFDAGVRRAAVTRDGELGLLLEYGAGGLTPGDAYLWRFDADGTPRGFDMWVSILPIGGLFASFEDWRRLETGVRVATRHRIGPVQFTLDEVRAAASLDALTGGEDPFTALDGE